MSGDDRRGFFKKMAGAAVGLAAADAVLAAPGAPVGTGVRETAVRKFQSSNFAIDLDGTMAGWLDSVEGGDATAEVVTEAPQEGCLRRKHLGNVKYEDMSISCGTGMSTAFYDWIQNFLGCGEKNTPRDGSIHATDLQFKELSRLDFFEALITEFSMPALDAASKDAAKMTLKFSPDHTRLKKGSGQVITPCASNKQKPWLPANFKLQIADLDCTHVNKVEALTVKQKVARDQVGSEREPFQLGPLEFPNLVVTLAESFAQSFYDWHESFVIKGMNDAGAEKTGTLEFLTPNLAQVLFTINFFGLGIFRLTSDKSEAGADAIKRVKAEMYCESMTFSFGKGTAAC